MGSSTPQGIPAGQVYQQSAIVHLRLQWPAERKSAEHILGVVHLSLSRAMNGQLSKPFGVVRWSLSWHTDKASA